MGQNPVRVTELDFFSDSTVNIGSIRTGGRAPITRYRL